MIRDRLLRGWVCWGVALVFITELLSPFSLLRPAPVAIFWAMFVAAVMAPLAVRAQDRFESKSVCRPSLHLAS